MWLDDNSVCLLISCLPLKIQPRGCFPFELFPLFFFFVDASLWKRGGENEKEARMPSERKLQHRFITSYYSLSLSRSSLLEMIFLGVENASSLERGRERRNETRVVVIVASFRLARRTWRGWKKRWNVSEGGEILRSKGRERRVFAGSEIVREEGIYLSDLSYTPTSPTATDSPSIYSPRPSVFFPTQLRDLSICVRIILARGEVVNSSGRCFKSFWLGNFLLKRSKGKNI